MQPFGLAPLTLGKKIYRPSVADFGLFHFCGLLGHIRKNYLAIL